MRPKVEYRQERQVYHTVQCSTSRCSTRALELFAPDSVREHSTKSTWNYLLLSCNITDREKMTLDPPASNCVTHRVTVEQELACSLNASSPGVPLLLLTVAGDLSAAVESEAEGLATILKVADFRFHNAMREGRWVRH